MGGRRGVGRGKKKCLRWDGGGGGGRGGGIGRGGEGLDVEVVDVVPFPERS